MEGINIKNIFANNSLSNCSLSNNLLLSNTSNNTSNNTLNTQEKSKSNSSLSIRDFSVNTLIESNTFKSTISDDYIINKIKLNKINNKKKIDDLYGELYIQCLIKINTAIEINLTEIIYSVELYYFGYSNYNSFECIGYIESKLKEKNFLTMIMSNKDIFISWKNIT